MATPRGATRRARTADLLVTKQQLFQLSYDGVFPSVVDHNIPGMGCYRFKLHTGLELLLRRYHSSYPSLSALALRCQVHPRGITELFSPAPVQSVASVSQFNSRASRFNNLSVASRCRVAPPAAGAPFPCIVSGAWWLTHCEAGRTRTGGHGFLLRSGAISPEKALPTELPPHGARVPPGSVYLILLDIT